ncbi:hypothetical protein BraRD5C2_38650 [Bradyrhizobium sp. RD5-C2]|nr:hypothetical protein BraRD5C2_38650 [Bradyrhizobium sp. RD5-C2]
MLPAKRKIARVCVGRLRDLDGSVRSKQGSAAPYDHSMIIDDQYSHDRIVLRGKKGLRRENVELDWSFLATAANL